jgi:eukaryotic-like serine/threonine-protein kinase
MLEHGQLVAGRFRIDRILGKGSMSHVWLATDGARKVALKVADDGGDGPIAMKRASLRLSSEAEVLALLDHPNVPHLVASSVENEPRFIAMELVDGLSIEQEIGRRARLHQHFAREDLIRIVEEIASTLAYAHSMSVVHRDLKPANVMLLDRAGRLYVKVLDFGVAKMLHQDQREQTTHGRIVGTPLYLSPEQVRASGTVSAKSDVFALGVLIFEMLTLHRAWIRGEDHRPLPSWRPPLAGARNNREQVLNRIVEGPRPSAYELRPELPPAVDRVLARALAIDPDDRYASALELVRDLRAVLTEPRAPQRRETLPERGVTVPERAGPTKPMFTPAPALPTLKQRHWPTLAIGFAAFVFTLTAVLVSLHG